MPANKDFALRIEIIDECLRNNLRKWTLDDLENTVNEKLLDHYGKTASRRTIQADMDYMKKQKDAPIESKREGRITYFFYSDKDYSIKNLPIKEEEVEILKDAIEILRGVNDFKILPEVDEIISKLKNTVRTHEAGSTGIIQFEKHTTALGSGYIDTAYAAIKRKSALRVTYQSFKSDTPNEHVFHPYLLKEYRNRWFVLGRQAGKKYVTVFALDRIKNIKNSADSYILNDLFDPDTYFHNLIGVTLPENAAVEIIEIKVLRKQAPYVKTKPIHHTQQIIKENSDGSLLIQLSLIINYELKSTLLGYGCEIEVVRPASLRTDLQAIFKEAADCYK